MWHQDPSVSNTISISQMRWGRGRVGGVPRSAKSGYSLEYSQRYPGPRRAAVDAESIIVPLFHTRMVVLGGGGVAPVQPPAASAREPAPDNVQSVLRLVLAPTFAESSSFLLLLYIFFTV